MAARPDTLEFAASAPLSPADRRALDRRAHALPGIVETCAGASSERLLVRFDPQVTRAALVRLALEGPDLRLLGAAGTWRRVRSVAAPLRVAEGVRSLWQSEQRVDAALVAACLLLGGAGALLQWTGASSAALVAFAGAYAAGGYRALLTTSTSLRRGRLDVDLLMLLAAGGAAAVGALWEGAVLLFLFSLGSLLEAFALGRTHRSVRALMDLRPETVSVKGPEGEVLVPADSVALGAVAVVRPGERIPVDGRVVEGHASVDQSTITGESMPLGRGPGDEVFAGTINLSGYLEVEVSRRAQETMLARVIRLVADAQASRAPAQRAIDRYQPVYVLAVLGIAGAGFLTLLGLGHAPEDAFLQAMTLLVVASPCALVISMPATMLSAIAAGARAGILVKGSGPLEAMGRLRTVALDKTGTLTRGELHLEEVHAAPGACPGQVLALAAAVEARSQHPVARAVVEAARASGLEVGPCEAFRATHGRGVEGRVGGRTVLVGSPGMMRERGVALGPLAGQGEAIGAHVVVGVEGRSALGLLVVRDEVRPEAAAAVAELRTLGLRTLMLSGDDAAVAERVGARVGVDEVAADLLPDAKLDRIRELERLGPVAMVGDGVNDAPALAAATVGVAMGTRGSDQALETADVVLMSDRLPNVAAAIRLSRRMRRVIRQNLAFAGGVILALSVLTVVGVLPLPLGVLGHEGSTILVTLNGLRMLRDATPVRRDPARARVRRLAPVGSGLPV